MSDPSDAVPLTLTGALEGVVEGVHAAGLALPSGSGGEVAREERAEISCAGRASEGEGIFAWAGGGRKGKGSAGSGLFAALGATPC